MANRSSTEHSWACFQSRIENSPAVAELTTPGIAQVLRRCDDGTCTSTFARLCSSVAGLLQPVSYLGIGRLASNKYVLWLVAAPAVGRHAPLLPWPASGPGMAK